MTRSATSWFARNAPDCQSMRVDERRLAVVDVRDDGDVADVGALAHKQLFVHLQVGRRRRLPGERLAGAMRAGAGGLECRRVAEQLADRRFEPVHVAGDHAPGPELAHRLGSPPMS